MRKNLAVLIIALFFNSCYYNDAIRNKLNFKNNVNDVQKALVEMSTLIRKLPKSEFNVNYTLDGDSIEINGGPGRSDSIAYYRNQGLSSFTQIEKKQFLALANYLKKNFITAGFIDSHSNLCLFSYREASTNTFNELRDITLVSEFVNNRYKGEFKVLDKMDEIFLIAPREAKIYNNYTLVDEGK